MTGEQLRMARAALKLGVRELSALASVDKMSIVGIENGRIRGHASTHDKLRVALEAAGIVFLDGKDDEYQPTVALRVGVVLVSAGVGERDTTGTPGEALDAHAWDEVCEDAAPVDELPSLPDSLPALPPATDEERTNVREYLKTAKLSAHGRAVLVRDFWL